MLGYHLSMYFSRPDTARKINKLKVLSELRKGPASKAELSRRLGINKVSIGEIVDSLMKENLIEPARKDNTTSGRPSMLMAIARNSGRVYSIEDSRSAISLTAYDLLARVIRFERIPKSTWKEEHLEAFIEKTASGQKVYGISVIGEDRSMMDALKLPYPSVFSSISHAEAVAEISSFESGLEGFLFLSWSSRIDASICRGRIIELPTLAHMKVEKSRSCRCGGTGCLDAVASGEALKDALGCALSKDVLSSPSSKAVSDASKAIALALSEAVQALNATSVMITGELSAFSDDVYASMQSMLSSILPPDRKDVVIYRGQNGQNGRRTGAGIIALDEFFYATGLLKDLSGIEALGDCSWI